MKQVHLPFESYRLAGIDPLCRALLREEGLPGLLKKVLECQIRYGIQVQAEVDRIIARSPRDEAKLIKGETRDSVSTVFMEPYSSASLTQDGFWPALKSVSELMQSLFQYAPDHNQRPADGTRNLKMQDWLKARMLFLGCLIEHAYPPGEMREDLLQRAGAVIEQLNLKSQEQRDLAFGAFSNLMISLLGGPEDERRNPRRLRDSDKVVPYYDLQVLQASFREGFALLERSLVVAPNNFPLFCLPYVVPSPDPRKVNLSVVNFPGFSTNQISNQRVSLDVVNFTPRSRTMLPPALAFVRCGHENFGGRMEDYSCVALLQRLALSGDDSQFGMYDRGLVGCDSRRIRPTHLSSGHRGITTLIVSGAVTPDMLSWIRGKSIDDRGQVPDVSLLLQLPLPSGEFAFMPLVTGGSLKRHPLATRVEELSFGDDQLMFMRYHSLLRADMLNEVARRALKNERASALRTSEGQDITGIPLLTARRLEAIRDELGFSRSESVFSTALPPAGLPGLVEIREAVTEAIKYIAEKDLRRSVQVSSITEEDKEQISKRINDYFLGREKTTYERICSEGNEIFRQRIDDGYPEGLPREGITLRLEHVVLDFIRAHLRGLESPYTEVRFIKEPQELHRYLESEGGARELTVSLHYSLSDKSETRAISADHADGYRVKMLRLEREILEGNIRSVVRNAPDESAVRRMGGVEVTSALKCPIPTTLFDAGKTGSERNFSEKLHQPLRTSAGLIARLAILEFARNLVDIIPSGNNRLFYTEPKAHLPRGSRDPEGAFIRTLFDMVQGEPLHKIETLRIANQCAALERELNWVKPLVEFRKCDLKIAKIKAVSSGVLATLSRKLNGNTALTNKDRKSHFAEAVAAQDALITEAVLPLLKKQWTILMNALHPGELRNLEIATPVEINDIEAHKFLFVCTGDNKIVFSNESARGGQSRFAIKISHSQIALGDNVYAAGEVLAERRNIRVTSFHEWHERNFELETENIYRLTELNNGSGHYRPDFETTKFGERALKRFYAEYLEYLAANKKAPIFMLERNGFRRRDAFARGSDISQIKDLIKDERE